MYQKIQVINLSMHDIIANITATYCYAQKLTFNLENILPTLEILISIIGRCEVSFYLEICA
jgi:hypothetical protein